MARCVWYTCGLMGEAAFLQVEPHAAALVALVKAEKVGAREAQIIEADLRAAAPGKKFKVLVDLTAVTLLASMGLGMLVSMHKHCAENGGRLVVTGLNSEITKLLKLTHLDRVIKTAADRDAAMKVLG